MYIIEVSNLHFSFWIP